MWGSPPRVRGKPAKAARKWLGAMDHPRVCGENVFQLGVPDANEWITPACAGKT